jgi:hypothetical protein
MRSEPHMSVCTYVVVFFSDSGDGEEGGERGGED